jgi:iron only hydrogenase large subunit-like protein
MYSNDYPTGARGILEHIRAFFKAKWGTAHVYDTSFARHVALLEQAREFGQRWPHTPQSSDKARGKMPMLSSACPGWVCYAEKAHPETLSHISTVRSPQAVQGTLVKRWISNKLRKDVYHVSVMMCYDKKLEASRPEFGFGDTEEDGREVDCVITTGELDLLLRQSGWAPGSSIEQLHFDSDSTKMNIPDLVPHHGTSSGSYLHSILSMLMDAPTSSTLRLGANLSRPLTLSSTTLRNADHVSYVLTDSTGKVVFKGATCYGFRNLQNVVRKLGKGSSGPGAGLRARVRRRRAAKDGSDFDQNDKEEREWDYVEVMACPSGCVNGGGQLKPAGEITEVREESAGPETADTQLPIIKGELEVGHEPVRDMEKQVLQNARWGDKDWTKRVEAEYWRTSDLLTPPPSRPTSPFSSSATLPWTPNEVLDQANRLALQLLQDICQPIVAPSTWEDLMDDAAEKARERLFRTTYRKVESEVNGLGVQW